MPELNRAQYKHLLSIIDHTCLQKDISSEDIKAFCQEAVTPFGNAAAVCIYPEFVRAARYALKQSEIKVATVANFPSGDESLDDTLKSIIQSKNDDADEIDLVLPYHQFLQHNNDFCLEFIKACKDACDNLTLKVIIEVSALASSENIRNATKLCCEAGADFIKTSTGKHTGGATLSAARVILNVLNNDYPHVGFKASGGINSATEASNYVALAADILGEAYVQPNTFRIGASKLLADIVTHLKTTNVVV